MYCGDDKPRCYIYYKRFTCMIAEGGNEEQSCKLKLKYDILIFIKNIKLSLSYSHTETERRLKWIM